MAGQYLEFLGGFTSGTYTDGVSTSTQQLTHTNTGPGLPGSRKGDMDAGAFPDAILISENGNSIVQVSSVDSTNTIGYALLAGTTNVDVQADFAAPQKYRVVFKGGTTYTSSEWTHYNGGGSFPFAGGVQPYDEVCGDLTTGDWVDGVDTVTQRITSVGSVTNGTYEDQLIALINNEMFCISETGGAVIQLASLDTKHTFFYDLIAGTTDANVQSYFSNDNTFRFVLKDEHVNSEWTYYNNGGTYPYVAPPPLTEYTRYRFRFSDLQGGTTHSNVAMAEVELRVTLGGVDETSNTGGTATAHHNIGASFVPAKAVDDDDATMWNGNSSAVDLAAGDVWWEFELNSTLTIVQYTVTARESFLDDSPIGWEILGWNGADWDILGTVTGEADWSGSETRTFLTNLTVAPTAGGTVAISVNYLYVE